MSRTLQTVLLSSVLAAAACSPRPNGTLLAVIVETDFQRGELDEICIKVTPSSGGGKSACIAQPVADGAMGARAGFVPEGNPNVNVTITATGMLNGVPVVEQLGTSYFQRDVQGLVRMQLARVCKEKFCGTSTTCTFTKKDCDDIPYIEPTTYSDPANTGGSTLAGAGGAIVPSGSGGKTGSGGSGGTGGKAGSGGVSGSGGAGGCDWASKPATTGITWSTSCPGYGTSGTYKGYWFAMSDSAGGGNSWTCPDCDAGCTPAVGNAICISGKAGKIIGTAYNTYWGAGLGWNLNQTATGCVGSTTPGAADLTGRSISYAIDAPPAALRIKLDTGNVADNVCLDINAKSSGTIAVSSFLDQCWTSGTRTPITAVQQQSVKAIQFMIPTSSSADIPFNFCVTSLSIQ